MKIPIKYFTDEIKAEYPIYNIAQNGWVHVEIRKGLYGPKESVIIAYKAFIEKIAPYGY